MRLRHKAIAIEGERILALVREDPRFGFAFMQRAAQTTLGATSAMRLQLLKAHGFSLPEVVLESDSSYLALGEPPVAGDPLAEAGCCRYAVADAEPAAHLAKL